MVGKMCNNLVVFCVKVLMIATQLMRRDQHIIRKKLLMTFDSFQIFSHCKNLQVQKHLYSEERHTDRGLWLVSSFNNSFDLHSGW